MSHLTDAQNEFLKKRLRMTKTWPAVGVVLIIIELGLAGWLLWKQPPLINPQAVLSGLRTRSLPDSTLSLMATLLPFVVILCLAVVAVLILFAFLALANEKKHMAIIRSFQKSSSTEGQKTGN